MYAPSRKIRKRDCMYYIPFYRNVNHMSSIRRITNYANLNSEWIDTSEPFFSYKKKLKENLN